MRKLYLILSTSLCLFALNVFGQTDITAVNTTNGTASGSTTYTNINTYNWGLAPNNTVTSLDGFTANGKSISLHVGYTGVVKVRRVDNGSVSGNYARVWAETNAADDYQLFPAYTSDMETFLGGQTYNKGADNIFTNTDNNIERVDWIRAAGFSSGSPTKMGFAVLDRGSNDNFYIAAITGIDGSNNPTSYGTIVFVSGYASLAGSSLRYTTLNGLSGNDLLRVSSNSQVRGGSFITLTDLGVSAGQVIYGYSIIPDDFAGSTSADVVDYTNATNYPTNTPGSGLDLVAVTGVYAENTILPIQSINLSANYAASRANLTWQVLGEYDVKKYELERSADGRQFVKVGEKSSLGNGDHNYQYSDNLAGLPGAKVYYRVKETDINGKSAYSNTIAVSLELTTDLKLYPVPFTDHVSLSLTVNRPTVISMKITDLNGQQLGSRQMEIAAGFNTVSLSNLDRLPAGYYWIDVNYDGNSKREKIVKLR